MERVHCACMGCSQLGEANLTRDDTHTKTRKKIIFAFMLPLLPLLLLHRPANESNFA